MTPIEVCKAALPGASWKERPGGTAWAVIAGTLFEVSHGGVTFTTFGHTSTIRCPLGPRSGELIRSHADRLCNACVLAFGP